MNERTVALISDVLMGYHDVPPTEVPGHRAVTSNPAIARSGAKQIVDALESEGLLARCICPVGFGQVRDRRCTAHRGSG